jgi:DNA-binding MurR/RpiR family transcriptional regulator
MIFAISFPRYSTNVINAVKYAHAQGAVVASLTDSTMSPIAKYAQYVLTAQSDMAAFADSLVAPLSIINAMIIEITQRRRTEIKERFERMERLWDEYDVYTKP